MCWSGEWSDCYLMLAPVEGGDEFEIAFGCAFEGVVLGYIAARSAGHGVADVGSAGEKEEVFKEEFFLDVTYVYFACGVVGEFLE